ncbi:hypothetical protein [Streptomyces sp. NPDC059909]|uniref:hypothetical protein n=1 Tax=Streptomyces sp. NPDC059909 TaxID=3346998 RepID=UPI0036600C6F
MADNRIRLVRPDDLLVASVQFHNLVLAPDGSALVRVVGGAPAGVVLRLPPQHYLEPALTSATQRLAEAYGLRHEPAYAVPLLAGPGARFEWALPAGLERVELDVGSGGLLGALAGLDPVPGGTRFDALANLSFQAADVAWALPPAPDGTGPRHPLWRVRADVPDGTVFPAGAPMHASFPHVLDAVLVTGRGADHVYGRDRLKAYGLNGPAGVTPSHPFPYFMRGFLARGLTATPLGGTVSLFGPTPGSGSGDGDSEAAEDRTAFGYEHRTSLGRDVYSRRTVTGCLSSGHRAVVTTVTERVLRTAQLADSDGPADTITATLRARAELVVTEPVLDLTALVGEYPHGGREIPFVALRVDVERTEVDVTADEDPTAPVRLTLGGAPIDFGLTGVDHTGRAVEFRTSLVFLPEGRPASDLGPLVPREGTPAALAPTPVALAPETGRGPGSTGITVAALGLAVLPGRSRAVLPTVGALQVRLDALAGLADRVPVVPASLDDTFLKHGLDGAVNPLGRLLALTPQTLELPTAGIGGLGNPGGVVDLLTAERGAIAGALAADRPGADVLRAAFPSARLLGAIDLRQLLNEASFEGLAAPLLTRLGPPGAETLSYRFEAKLAGSDAVLPVLVEPGARLLLDARIYRSGAAGLVATSQGEVTGVGFRLPGIVELRFGRIEFTTDAGGRTSVGLGPPPGAAAGPGAVPGIDVRFLGAFEFMAEIARKLGELTGGSGARVDVDGKGVTAGFQLAIPTLPLGVMQLANLSVAAFLRIPFEDGPICFTLDVASRERPFLATVSVFGGGGYLSLEATPDGVRRLEAAVEFGGSMSLDIVVASGAVSVMAGIYFGLTEATTPQGTEKKLVVSAFVRASGHLTVLGIVSVFVEFRMALEYARTTVGGSEHAVFRGTASVTVGVKVLFFSKSVTLTVSREFLGSAADPTFLDCYDTDDWDTYCLAFSPGAGAPAVPGDPFGQGAGA